MRKIALVVGVDHYDDYYNSLKKAVDDASRVGAFLQYRLGFERISLFNPTAAEVERKLTAIQAELDDDSTFVFYFAGHGVCWKTTTEAFLLCRDATRGLAQGSSRTGGLEPSFFAAFAREAKGNLAFIYDACRTEISGRSGAATIEGVGSFRDVSSTPSSTTIPASRWSLTSCDDGRIANDDGSFVTALLAEMAEGLDSIDGLILNDAFVERLKARLNASQRPISHGAPLRLSPRRETPMDDSETIRAVGLRIEGLRSYFGLDGAQVEQNFGLRLLERASDAGSLEARSWVAFAYFYGEGTAPQKEKARELALLPAEKGYPAAADALGACYAEGIGCEKDDAKAEEWRVREYEGHKARAEKGDAVAQAYLGNCLSCGEGVDKDYTKAVEWYRKAAEQGLAKAQNNLGNCYYNGKGVEQDYTKAVEWYRKAAEQGLAKAQNNLGNRYCNGEGVDKDYTKAVEWYRKAAEQGLAKAQNNLGNCYYNGKGVERDYTKAVEWYRKAAEQGLDNAQNNLGNCYYYDNGVEQDYTKAVEWYRKAAEQGLDNAQNNLGNCYYYGKGVDKDLEAALEWYRKAQTQGYDVSRRPQDVIYELGKNYYDGKGVEQDYAKAVAWFQKGDALKDGNAQNALGVCYRNGEGVEQDFQKAAELFQKAAEQGNVPAYSNFGLCYYKGEGVEQDYAKAVEWFKKGSFKSDAEAEYNLGNCYYNGEGVSQSDYEAAQCYRYAGGHGHVEGKRKGGELAYKLFKSYLVQNSYEKTLEWLGVALKFGNEDALKAIEKLRE